MIPPSRPTRGPEIDDLNPKTGISEADDMVPRKPGEDSDRGIDDGLLPGGNSFPMPEDPMPEEPMIPVRLISNISNIFYVKSLWKYLFFILIQIYKLKRKLIPFINYVGYNLEVLYILLFPGLSWFFVLYLL